MWIKKKEVEKKEIVNSDEKSAICDEVLRALPSWFGLENSIVDYVKQVKAMHFYGAFCDNIAVGFVAIKTHNPFTAEVYVMGVLEEFHGQGIGRQLIEVCEKYCENNKIEFLTVKTLDASRANESYDKTRMFYQAVGFKPIEVFPLLWDKDNPCLLMAKYILQ
ncbi:MAG: GNAT family N-acetyltransferase [Defluviitaleaceae bacterium]|nr:GNAT family N-acetyltransferase [Defluviitaleaceae bacterium]